MLFYHFSITFLKKNSVNTFSVSKSLDPDQVRHNVRPDLGPNCLQIYQQTTLAGKELSNIVAYEGFFWFGLLVYIPVNNHGHVGMATAPNHTFFLGKLD